MTSTQTAGQDAKKYVTDGEPAWTGDGWFGDWFPEHSARPMARHRRTRRCVIAGMGDGSTQALSKRIDAANFFFLITKNNSDPFYIP